MHDNRSGRAEEPLIIRPVGGTSKVTDPKKVYFEKSEHTVTVVDQHALVDITQSERTDEPENNSNPRTTRKDRKRSDDDMYFEKIRFNVTYTLSTECAATRINNDSEETNRRPTVGNTRPPREDPRYEMKAGYLENTRFAGRCTKGIHLLCTCAKCAHEKANSKTGTLFLYSKSIGAFNDGIGFFSIRLAESHWFGLIETAQSITIACLRKSPCARVFTTACPRKSPRARVFTIACPW